MISATTSIQIEKALGLSRISAANLRRWEQEKRTLFLCKEDMATSSECMTGYSNDREGIENCLRDFQNRASKWVVSYLVDLCMKELCKDEQKGGWYIDQMMKLDKYQLFCVIDVDRYRLVEEFDDREHQDTLYKIKCMKDMRFLEKRDLMYFYMLLSDRLCRWTMARFPEARDDVREQTRSKVLSYELFYEFIERLSERDSLIAELLYFGAPGMEDVLKIKISDLIFGNDQIIFDDVTCRFPKHVMFGVQNYLSSRPKKDSLNLFVNVRGELLDRNNLWKSFRKVSESVIGIPVTPRLLQQSRFCS